MTSYEINDTISRTKIYRKMVKKVKGKQYEEKIGATCKTT